MENEGRSYPVYCRSCEYNLTGVPAGKCPECARVFDPADPASYEERPRGRTRQAQYAVGIGFTLAITVISWLGFHTKSPPLLLLMVIATGVPGLAAVVAGMGPRRSAPSRALALLALLPMMGMLGLFYSLALHMHHNFGGWPKAIGTRGFSSSLETHAIMAIGCSSILVLLNLFVLPIALLLCVFVRRWKGGLFYLGIYALSYCAGFGAMLLAPSPFLYWWWD